MCAVIALYCPEKLSWSEIAGIAGNVSEPSTDNNSNNQSMADSLYNIQLVQRFSRDSLPFNFCHLSIEDVVYLHDSIRSNMTCFLADLFTGLEVRPVASFVQRPGIKKERVIQVPDPGMCSANLTKSLIPFIYIYGDFMYILPFIFILTLLIAAFKMDVKL